MPARRGPRNTRSRLHGSGTPRGCPSGTRRTGPPFTAPRCLAALTPEQRQVLWIGREFAIAPQYVEEQAREAGVVQFGTAEELPALAQALRLQAQQRQRQQQQTEQISARL